MPTETKSCALTEDEIDQLISWHGHNLSINSAMSEDHTPTIERISYLNKRLKAFQEPEQKVEKQEAKAAADPIVRAHPNTNSGWGNNG